MGLFLRFILSLTVVLLASFANKNPVREERANDFSPPPQQIVEEKQEPPQTANEQNVSDAETPKVEEVPETPSVNIAQKQETTIPPSLPKNESAEKVDFEAININARKSLANILCIAKGNSLLPTTGSGVFVSEKGVILTNAHIGQYFLLEDFVDCYIRTGNPATTKYKASLLYISKKWLAENSASIVTENPKGTGENDYAFLLVTRTTDSSQLPDTFHHLEMETVNEENKNDSVLIAGYAAGFLGGLVIENNLSILSTINSVSDIFTFKEKTVDLLSIKGSIISQKGASGGAVVDGKGKLVGIIATATQEPETGKRELRAITATHINRSFLEESGESISSLFSQNLALKSAFFKDFDFPLLKKILVDEIERKNRN